MSYGSIPKLPKRRNRARHGEGFGVQDHSKGASNWSKEDDELLLSTSTPTEKQFGQWVVTLNRPRSTVLARHAYVWELKRREREKFIAEARAAQAAKENQIGQ